MIICTMHGDIHCGFTTRLKKKWTHRLKNVQVYRIQCRGVGLGLLTCQLKKFNELHRLERSTVGNVNWFVNLTKNK